jgi:hypothetical protein
MKFSETLTLWQEGPAGDGKRIPLARRSDSQ